MCKGDLPRRREQCHLEEEGTQSHIGDWQGCGEGTLA